MNRLNSITSRGQLAQQRLLLLATSRSARSYRIAFALLVVCVALVGILLVKIGSIHQNGFGHDSPVLLDGGWRVLQGQRPHVDFYTPLGAVIPLLVAFGMSVAEPSTNALAYGSVLVFVILTLAAWCVAQSRMSAVNALVCAVFVGFVAVSPHPLGFGILNTSYAMIYNRFGFAILCILFVELFLPAAERTVRRDFLGGLLTGALIVILFFLKYTYFFAACAAVLMKVVFSFAANDAGFGGKSDERKAAGFASLIARRGRDMRSWLSGLVVGALLVFVPMMWFLRFDFAALFADAQMVARARGATLSAEKLWGVINLRDNIIAFALLVLFWLIIRQSVKRLAGALYFKIKSTLILAATVVCSLMLIMTNYQWGEVPLFPVAALIVWESVARLMKVRKSGQTAADDVSGSNSGAYPKPRAYLCSWFVALALVGQIFIADAASVGYAAWWHFKKADGLPAAQRFESKPLRDLIVTHWGGGGTCTQAPYVEKINDALSMVKPRLKDDSRILVMDVNNPFSFGLGLPSPHGDALYWHYGTHFNSQNGVNFTEQSHPPPEKVFADVTIVMIPKCAEEDETVQMMLKIYREYVLAHFYQDAESKYWIMMAKRQ